MDEWDYWRLVMEGLWSTRLPSSIVQSRSESHSSLAWDCLLPSDQRVTAVLSVSSSPTTETGAGSTSDTAMKLPIGWMQPLLPFGGEESA
jgi:hypothetical protein